MPITLPRTDLCAVTLWPAAIKRGVNAKPETEYSLVPHGQGNARDPFQFVAGQKFIALVTHSDDAKAGWVINAGSLTFGTETIAPSCFGDLGFAIFTTVTGLLMLGDYADLKIQEQVTLKASATLYGDPAPMRHGLTILFQDGRCRDMIPRWLAKPTQHESVKNVVLDIAPSQMIVVQYETPESGSSPKSLARSAAAPGFAETRVPARDLTAEARLNFGADDMPGSFRWEVSAGNISSRPLGEKDDDNGPPWEPFAAAQEDKWPLLLWRRYLPVAAKPESAAPPAAPQDREIKPANPEMPVLYMTQPLRDGSRIRVVLVYEGEARYLESEGSHRDAAGQWSWERRAPGAAFQEFGAVLMADPNWSRPGLSRNDALVLLLSRL